MTICFWCRNPKDNNNPDNIEISYVPCLTCSRAFAQGVPVAELDTKPYLNQPPVNGTDIYPTGIWCVLPIEEAQKLLGDVLEKVPDTGGGMIFIPMQQYRALGLHPKFKNMH